MNLGNRLVPKLRADWEAASRRRAAASPSPDEVAHGQLAAIGAAWKDAVSDIPHYAKLVADGIAPPAISGWDDFQAIPPLTRRQIQDHPEAFIRRSCPPAGLSITAGSTGTPLRLGFRRGEGDTMRIVKLAEWLDLGYERDSRMFLVWGHSHLLGTGWRGRVNHVRRKLSDVLMGYRRVDAYRLTPEDCRRYAAALIRHRPHGVIGYASALDTLATHASDQRARLRSVGIRFVLATAEPFPRPDSQTLIRDTFACPVVQEYGGVEFGQVAFKVDDGPFKVYPDLNYVETAAADSSTDGEIPLRVTSLYRRYVPLFRYEVGDAVHDPSLLPHGHVQRFARIAGRLNDQIPLDDGSAVHSVAVFHCIHKEPNVLNIQMRIGDDGIDIRLLARDSAATDRQTAETRIRNRLAQVHPQLARARIEWVDDLQTNRAGKRRWYIDERTGRGR